MDKSEFGDGFLCDSRWRRCLFREIAGVGCHDIIGLR